MPEQEPSFEEQLEALKLAFQNFEQASDPQQILDQTRDLLSNLSWGSGNLLNDFMTQRREVLELWQTAETEERKAEIKARIQRMLERVIEAVKKRPKN